MPKISKLTESASDTFNLGKEIASLLSPNSIVLFTGNLGAGKTQMIKGFASYFGIDEASVQSPTYSLLHTYEGYTPIHHFDLYRIQDTKEFIHRGFLDILETTSPIFIEWPSQVDSYLFRTKKIMTIDINTINQQQRAITITYNEN